jgi:hypothetical protein
MIAEMSWSPVLKCIHVFATKVSRQSRHIRSEEVVKEGFVVATR